MDVSPEEVGKALGFTAPVVREMVKSGEIFGIVSRGKIVIPLPGSGRDGPWPAHLNLRVAEDAASDPVRYAGRRGIQKPGDDAFIAEVRRLVG